MFIYNNKIRSMKYILLIPFLIIFNSRLTGQIKNQIESSQLIIKGEVIDQNSNWNSDKSLIFTTHKVRVLSQYKGFVQDSILTIKTLGGRVGSSLQFQNHDSNILLNDRGFFFLYQDNSNDYQLIHPNKGYVNSSKEVFVDNRAYSELGYETLITNETRFPIINAKNFDRINSFFQLNQAPDSCGVLTQSVDSVNILFYFDSVRVTNNYQNIEFDIMAKTNLPGIAFGGGDLLLNYSQEYGSNLVSQELLEIKRGIILEDLNYSLSAFDSEEHAVSIEIDSDEDSSMLPILDAQGASLLKVVLDVSLINTLENISFDSLSINHNAYFICGGEQEDFDNISFGSLPHAVESINGQPDIGVKYELRNPIVSQDESTYSFDIFVSSTSDTEYAAGDIYIDYSNQAFGNFVNDSPNFDLDRGVDFQNLQVYPIFVDDYPENGTLEIIIGDQFSEAIFPGEYTEISDNPKHLITIHLPILDCDVNKSIKFNDFIQVPPDPVNGDPYYNAWFDDNPPEDGFYYVQYDPIVTEGSDLGPACECQDVPVITSFSPLSIPAGMDQVLTIKGENFADSKGRVFFPDGDVAGFSNMEIDAVDIISWTDTEIEINLPGTAKGVSLTSPPCSGFFEIETECGVAESPTELEIPYAETNVRKTLGIERIALPDDICIGFSSQVPMHVRSTFRDAMNKWCELVDMHIEVDYENSSSINEAVIDGYSLVVIEEVITNNSSAAVVFQDSDGVAPLFYVEECLAPGENNMMREIDMRIDPTVINGSILALRNILLHEIGHILMLAHSRRIPESGMPVNNNYAMFSDVTSLNTASSPQLLTIKDEDELGALQIFAVSQSVSTGCPSNPITNGGCNDSCVSTNVDDIFSNDEFSIVPNPSKGPFRIDFVDNLEANSTLNIFSSNGQNIFSKKFHKGQNGIFIDENLDAGIYIVEIFDTNGKYWIDKILIYD